MLPRCLVHLQGDLYNLNVRQVVVSTGPVTTLAGSGTRGYADGAGKDASFYSPSGIATDSVGSIAIVVSELR